MCKVSNYIWQSALLVLFVFTSLMLFYWRMSANVLWAVGASSLASSAYIVFGKPSSVAARPQNIILAYIVAMTVGIFCRLIFELHLLDSIYDLSYLQFYWNGLFAAIAVALSLVITVKLRLDHPPSAGVALVLVIDVQDYHTLIIVLFSVIMLSLLSLAFRRRMRDLF